MTLPPYGFLSIYCCKNMEKWIASNFLKEVDSVSFAKQSNAVVSQQKSAPFLTVITAHRTPMLHIEGTVWKLVMYVSNRLIKGLV